LGILSFLRFPIIPKFPRFEIFIFILKKTIRDIILKNNAKIGAINDLRFLRHKFPKMN
jgi:hypothetical protein